MVVGGLVSTITTTVLVSMNPVEPGLGVNPLHGLFVLVGVAAGVGVGSGIAFAEDWWSDHHVTHSDLRLLQKEDRHVLHGH